MTKRAIASIALIAAVALGTTGCNMLAPQATTIHYSAAEGVNVPNTSGPVDIRNAMLIMSDDGTDANLVAAFVNETGDSETVRIDVEGTSTPLSVRVGAKQTISLGATTEPLLVPEVDVKPGETIPIYFQSGDGDGALIEVPVLDGALPYLKELVPSPTATATATE